LRRSRWQESDTSNASCLSIDPTRAERRPAASSGPWATARTRTDADPEFDAAFRRHASVALDEAVLHLDSAAHVVDHAAELDEAAVAGALDDAPVVGVDGGIDQIAAQPLMSISVSKWDWRVLP